jgi:Mg2+ and Co2+ transporter CorA
MSRSWMESLYRLESLEKENAQLKRQISEMTDIIKFYAYESWEYCEILKRFGEVQSDEGQKARDFLEKNEKMS